MESSTGLRPGVTQWLAFVAMVRVKLGSTGSF